MEKPKVIVIVGPTASGKTAVSFDIARAYDVEIIAADSRTIYRKMNIGTAKPEGEKVPAAVVTAAQVEEKGIHEAKKALSIESLVAEKPYMVEGVPHWGIDIVDVNEEFNVAQFKEYAEGKIAEIVARGHVPMIVGGTGLYVDALIDNFQFEGDEKGPRKYEALKIGMKVDRETLNERIDERVDKMVAEGLVDEVRALKDEYGCEDNAMTGIGYRQICEFLDGYLKLKDAIEVVKRATRQYAKRQMTWFKRDTEINWIEDPSEAMPLVEAFLK